jgi:hypothetical protein
MKKSELRKLIREMIEQIGPISPGKKPGRPDVSSVRPSKPDVSYPSDNPNYIGPATPILGYDCVPPMYQGEPNDSYGSPQLGGPWPYDGPPIYDYGNTFMDVNHCRPIFDVPGNAGYQPHYSSQAECQDSQPNSNWCYQPEIVDAMSRRKLRTRR